VRVRASCWTGIPRQRHAPPSCCSGAASVESSWKADVHEVSFDSRAMTDTRAVPFTSSRDSGIQTSDVRPMSEKENDAGSTPTTA
jgi:hypothetical protein